MLGPEEATVNWHSEDLAYNDSRDDRLGEDTLAMTSFDVPSSFSTQS